MGIACYLQPQILRHWRSKIVANYSPKPSSLAFRGCGQLQPTTFVTTFRCFALKTFIKLLLLLTPYAGVTQLG